MSKPFTIAKAIAVDSGKIVMGSVDRDRGTIRSGDSIITIAPTTLCFNTGFESYTGAEIFEGDYIRTRFSDFDELVFFDDERGAFFLSHVESLNETEIAGDEEFRFCSYPNATVIRRLIQSRANSSDIIGSILEALAATPVDDTTPADAPLSPEEIAVLDPDSVPNAFDTIPVDPDAGDDISIDWGKRVDEATGEY